MDTKDHDQKSNRRLKRLGLSADYTDYADFGRVGYTTNLNKPFVAARLSVFSEAKGYKEKALLKTGQRWEPSQE